MKQIIPAAIIAFSFFVSESHAQSQCGNIDFEDSSFVNWSGGTASNTNGVTQPFTWTPGIVTSGPNTPNTTLDRHTIITVNQIDSTVWDPATMAPDTQMTTLAPNGGTASVRLGNRNAGAEAEKLSVPYTVTAQNSWFQFQFASIMEDPQHLWDAQPFFMVNVYDQTMTPVPALCDTIWAGDTSVPYIISGSNFMHLYRRWTPLSIDLSAMIGTTVTIEFVNSDCMFGGHFGYTYIDVSCFGTGIPNVWPGDCDYDLQANNMDLLTLGIAYGATGPIRPSATTTWQAEPSSDWSQSIALGANFKHSDTNGDGVVDLNDTLAISNNYAQTHTFRMAGPSNDAEVRSAPALYLQPQADTVGELSYAYIDVYIANAQTPVNDLFGLAFTIQYDNTLVQNGSATTSFTGSIMGVKNTSVMTLSHDDYATGQHDISLVRMNHSEVNGYGYIGTLRITTAGVTQMSELNLAIVDVHAINAQNVTIPLTATGTAVVIDPALGVNDPAPATQIGLYPNPANETIVVSSEAAEKIEITNALGQVVSSVVATGTSTSIDISSLSAGLYFVNVYNAQGRKTERLIVE